MFLLVHHLLEELLHHLLSGHLVKLIGLVLLLLLLGLCTGFRLFFLQLLLLLEAVLLGRIPLPFSLFPLGLGLWSLLLEQSFVHVFDVLVSDLDDVDGVV